MKPAAKSRLLVAVGIAWALAIGVVLVTLPQLVSAPVPELPRYTPHSGPLRVVASVAVWADVAKQVGGDKVEVSAVLTSAQQDPHSYEASARDQLLVNQADLTVANGGFYDQFFSLLEQASPNQHRYMRAEMVMVSSAYAKDGSPVALNDHVWYDLNSVKRAADELSYRINLGLGEQASKQAVRSQTRAFQKQIGELQKVQNQLKTRVAGKKAIATEGFVAYLLHNLQITDATPTAFKHAVEEESDASPAVMEQLRSALLNHSVNILIVNQQTESAQTKRLVTWAKQAGVPVVRLSETLPVGMNYQTWMLGNLNQLAKAIG